MTGTVALKSAYAVVWVIELLYIWYLVGRYRQRPQRNEGPRAVQVRANVSEKHGTLRVIAAANFIFAALFLIFSLPFFWHQVQVLRTWPETDAQVLQSEVVAGPPSGHDNLYRAKLQVLYTVGGTANHGRDDELREHQL